MSQCPFDHSTDTGCTTAWAQTTNAAKHTRKHYHPTSYCQQPTYQNSWLLINPTTNSVHQSLTNAMPCTRKRTTSTQDHTPEDKTNPNSSQAASGIVPAKRLTDKEELSIVIYRLLEEAGTVKLEAMPLDFICGMVTNNAKNNGVAVRELKKLKWPRFKGNTQWIQCFAHTLNLIAQAILRPFGAQKKNGATDNPGSKPDGIDSGNESAQEQISMLLCGHTANLQDEESSRDVDSNSKSDEDKTESLVRLILKMLVKKMKTIAKHLHPANRPWQKDKYFKLANWEPKWITEAIQLAQDMWVSFYKPKTNGSFLLCTSTKYDFKLQGY
ncbi:hypothetical protein PCANC_06511 [Puccinia coronata f. sp. avenae]|uniref:DUF659 domain-containing protein n=1 Tax=Puccinia coronata f. sp. avenae TaxID=200324 RepID=A0A2N5VAM6_9BASI|nr:hypothetical protein PCANC_06511 [Puccinia coronata f. sp. avenae]